MTFILYYNLSVIPEIFRNTQIWLQSSIHTPTLPMSTLVTLMWTQVLWFFPEPNPHRPRDWFCATIWIVREDRGHEGGVVVKLNSEKRIMCYEGGPPSLTVSHLLDAAGWPRPPAMPWPNIKKHTRDLAKHLYFFLKKTRKVPALPIFASGKSASWSGQESGCGRRK